MADNFFSIDIGERYTKVVDSKLNANFLEFNSLGKIDTAEAFYTLETEKNIETETANINKLIDSLKITKKNVNVIIPSAATYSQILMMPLLNEKELISAIKYQADQFIPMPIEETNIDLEIIDEFKDTKKILVLIVAAPKKIIEKVQNAVEGAGLIPDSIENELSASARFVNLFPKQLFTDLQSGIISLNIGGNASNLTYFANQSYNLTESHNFSIGYQLFLKEIQINTDSDIKKSTEILATYDKKANSSFAVDTIISPLLKDMTIEIQRFVATKKVNHMYLYNQSCLFPGLGDLLAAQTGIPTSQFDIYGLSKKNPLLDTYKKELALYVSSIGGNFR